MKKSCMNCINLGKNCSQVTVEMLYERQRCFSWCAVEEPIAEAREEARRIAGIRALREMIKSARKGKG